MAHFLVNLNKSEVRRIKLFFFFLFISSVTAACAIANIVKSSLGPVGLDKMLVDDIGVSKPSRKRQEDLYSCVKKCSHLVCFVGLMCKYLVFSTVLRGGRTTTVVKLRIRQCMLHHFRLI